METWTPVDKTLWLRTTQRAPFPTVTKMAAGKNDLPRKLLWVDAVGGFLICLEDQVVLGQPSSNGPIAVPILADLSRRHAVIRRDSGAYVIEPIGPVRLEGNELHGPAVLTDNQSIQLGESVRLRFQKPHALSSTARLTLESYHKTEPSVDAVLLLADSCLLGPGSHCHVVCPKWEREVLLYKQQEQLYCRTEGPIVQDGVPCSGPAILSPNTRIEGDDFSLSLEEVE